MSGILRYHPQYEYKRKLTAVLQDKGVMESSPDPLGHGPLAGNNPSTPSERLRADGAAKSYTPSQALADYVDITPTDVLQGHLEATRSLAQLHARIQDDLKGAVTIGPPLAEYIEAKRPGGNLDVVYEFEDLHAGSVDGLTAAEVLPVIQDFLDELEALGEFIEAHIGPLERLKEKEELNEDGSLVNPELDRLRETEEAEIKQMAELDRQGELDWERANERNHLLGFLHQRFDGLLAFAEEVSSLISDTPRSAYGGAAEQIVRTLANVPDASVHFGRTALERFEKHARNTADAHARMRRLITARYKKRLLEETLRAQEAKLEARRYIEQVEQLNPPEEGDPFNLFLMDTLESIEALRRGADELVEDLYRISGLERLQSFDYLHSLRQKNEARQVYALIGGATHMNWTEVDTETSISRLLDVQ